MLQLQYNKTYHKIHFTLGTTFYIFRYQGAILRDLNKNNVSWVEHVIHVMKYVLNLSAFVVI